MKVKFNKTDEAGVLRELIYKSREVWRFTDDERKELEMCLTEKRGISKVKDWKQNIEAFILNAENVCHCAKEFLDARERLTVEDVRDGKDKLLKSSRETAKLLHSVLEKQRKLFRPQRLVDVTMIPIGARAEFQRKLFTYAHEAVNGLDPLITFLEFDQSHKTKIGRPQSEAFELIKNAATLYHEFIGRPTSYKIGTFTKVSEILLDAVGLPSTSPLRTIERVLKSLKT
jgi:hypothetical protein